MQFVENKIEIKKKEKNQNNRNNRKMRRPFLVRVVTILFLDQILN